MTKEEKREYIENIFEMVLSGEENFELAESLITSLNLHDEFKNYANKEKDKRRVKISFNRNEMFGNRNRNQSLNEIRKATNEAHKINDFLVFLYFKMKRKELAEYTKQKPQRNEGAKV